MQQSWTRLQPCRNFLHLDQVVSSLSSLPFTQVSHNCPVRLDTNSSNRQYPNLPLPHPKCPPSNPQPSPPPTPLPTAPQPVTPPLAHKSTTNARNATQTFYLAEVMPSDAIHVVIEYFTKRGRRGWCNLRRDDG